MNIQFCGAAQEVTGSCHLITLKSGYKILLDCGLFQGKDVEHHNDSWFFKPSDIDCVILSHAHIDHTGRLPKLVKDGYKGSVYSTHATRSLCSIMLLDSARIQIRDAEIHNRRALKMTKKKRKKKKMKIVEPLYDENDATNAMQQFVSFGYNQWFYINKNIQLQFKDSGHILGSASISLKIKDGKEEKTIGFTGDIGRPERPILRNPSPMPSADIVISESTYGNKFHESHPEQYDKFLSIIKHTCLEKRGKLVIPAFSVGRTQEIVYMLDKLENKGLLPKIPVYVDSPLAVNATLVFGAHPECYDSEINRYMLTDANPFGFNDLTYVREVSISKELNVSTDPCIIISSAGMMNAGRVKHHLFHNIDNPINTFLIVGYCSPSTPGGILKTGVEEIKVFGEWKPVKAEIEVMDSFSAHGDQKEMLDFLSNQTGAKSLFLVHGELDSQKAFKKVLIKKGFKNVQIPVLGSEVDV
jgi:metallo-beta-lactamase family protein